MRALATHSTVLTPCTDKQHLPVCHSDLLHPSIQEEDRRGTHQVNKQTNKTPGALKTFVSLLALTVHHSVQPPDTPSPSPPPPALRLQPDAYLQEKFTNTLFHFETTTEKKIF